MLPGCSLHSFRGCSCAARMASEQPSVENPVSDPQPQPQLEEPQAEMVVPDHKPTMGIEDDPWGLGAQASDGKIKFVVTMKSAAIALVLVVLMLAVYPLLAGGDGGGEGQRPPTTPGTEVDPDLSCQLLPGGGAPPGKWNVEYFSTNHLDIPVVTLCELPNRPEIMNNGATAAVLAFYAAVDTKDLAGIAQATGAQYTASINGCASIGGVQGCSCNPVVSSCSGPDKWVDGQALDARQFAALVGAYPPRAGGTYVRDLTVDAGKDGSFVVLNQYSTGDGRGTAVHTVEGCPSACRVAQSTWINGALDPSDVAGETADATYISHFWEGGVGPAALDGQHDHFALRYSGEFQFDADVYQFWASSDDGSRLYVDDKLVLDRWGACCDIWHADPIALSAGSHSVVLEYSQGGGGAFLELGWQKFLGCPSSSPLLATYYPGDEIDESRQILGGCTSNIRSDWGRFGPVELVADMQLAALDHFSVRWDGSVTFIQDEYYVFSTFADDGSRLSLDGESIIDRWEQCCVAFSSQPIAISGTKHLRYEMHVRILSTSATSLLANYRSLHFQTCLWLTLLPGSRRLVALPTHFCPGQRRAPTTSLGWTARMSKQWRLQAVLTTLKWIEPAIQSTQARLTLS